MGNIPAYSSSVKLLEVTVKLWLDEDNTVEQFLDDFILVGLVLLGDLCTLDFSFLINGSLDGLDVSGVLVWYQIVSFGCGSKYEGRTDASKALKSRSLDCLYSSISLLACVRASLSRCTRSKYTASV